MPNTKLTYSQITPPQTQCLQREIWASPNKYQFTANKHIKTVSTTTDIDTHHKYINTKHEDMRTYASEIDNNENVIVFLERSEPSHECSEPSHECSELSPERAEPSPERAEPSHERAEPTHECSEPSHERSEPSHERAEPSHECSEPSHERSEPYNEGLLSATMQYYSILHKN